MSFPEKNNWLILIEASPKTGTSQSPSNLCCFETYDFEVAGSPSGLPASMRAGDISQCQDLNRQKRTAEIALVKSQNGRTALGITINESLSSHNLLIDYKHFKMTIISQSSKWIFKATTSKFHFVFRSPKIITVENQVWWRCFGSSGCLKDNFFLIKAVSRINSDDASICGYVRLVIVWQWWNGL